MGGNGLEVMEPIYRDVGVVQETLTRGYVPHSPGHDGYEYHEKFLSATYPHIWSFNLFLDFYIHEIVKNLTPVYVVPNQRELDPFQFIPEYLRISVSKVELGKPRRIDVNATSDMRMFPRHARTSHITYGAPLYISFIWNNTAGQRVKEKRVFSGLCPVMVRSKACHLANLTPFEMARLAGEDINEPGGYFIVNGNERGVRFVIQQRCNYAIGIQKSRLASKDVFYTEYAVSFRGMRRDGTSTNNILFFTTDHQCVFRILLNRSEWTCPFWLVLKALFPTVNLAMIKEKILDGIESEDTIAEIDSLWDDMVEGEVLHTDLDAIEDRYLSQLGYFFYDGVHTRLPPGSTYAAAGRYVINEYILVHTSSWNGKLETLLHMWRKLWALKDCQIPSENIDSFAFQEVLGPGQLFAAVLKDALFNTLHMIKSGYDNELREAKLAGDDPFSVIRSEGLFEQIVNRSCQGPARALSYFIATGNIRTYQLDLQQTAGWTITADRLNMNRFIAHFRAVHRGQFFAKMRTTEVRKLVGETWGFVCPVHTPDGPCCGLLLHLAQDAVVVADPPDGRFRASVVNFLETQNIRTDITGRMLTPACRVVESFPIVVDGEPLCRIPRIYFDEYVDMFLRLKNGSQHGFESQIELCAFKKGCGAFEGIYMFSGPGRLVRPVRNVRSNCIEWIGPLAQPWLSIACCDSDVEQSRRAISLQQELIKKIHEGAENIGVPFQAIVGAYSQYLQNPKAKSQILQLLNIPEGSKDIGMIQTCPVDYDYVEVSATSFLSILASFTPLSNHNQSPRNMYQCQMLKQTMGTPYHCIAFRTDNKVYRLLNPNRPLVRNRDYRRYDFDPYASGTNAVVAVISYTGFDMEDAMIINKHAIERGAFDGCVYKTKVIEAAPTGTRTIDARNFVFANRRPGGGVWEPRLCPDGLPAIGTRVCRDSPLYRVEDLRKKAIEGQDIEGSAGHVSYYHDDEEGFIENIHLTNPAEERYNKFGAPITSQRVLLTIRCIRRPIIGDKFASRAGQKGILSLLYPPEDMPFSASGIVPDIVFNPHGFPSRMTIGMIVESMAGKAACLTGQYQDSTPFDTFPLQSNIDRKNRWIDQGGLNGWSKRGGRYMSKAELKDREDDSPVDYFGKILLDRGYQYFGCETLYSGIHGVEMKAQIFMGIIYYQRLRHMVSDKWQCRSIGPIDHLTRQPLKGRKRGGGVRLGEMERDALLGHGAAFILQDRLVACSDGHEAYICPSCGSILSPCIDVRRRTDSPLTMMTTTTRGCKSIPICRVCQTTCRLAVIPYVFRYISNELAAMNIAIKLKLSECDRQVVVKPLIKGGPDG